MKRIIAELVIMLLLLNCTHSWTVYQRFDRAYVAIDNDYVGDVIDKEEREQFGLMPGVKDFIEARFFKIVGGGYVLEILTDSLKLGAVNRDIYAITILQDYFDRYDEIKNSKDAFEKQWQIVDYDELGFAITKMEVGIIKRSDCCFGNTLGCLSFSAVLLALPIFGAYASGYEIEFSSKFWLVVAGFIGVSFLVGVLTGTKVDNAKAVKVIKEARKPIVMEHM